MIYFIILSNMVLRRNEVLSILYIGCGPPLPKVNKTYYGSYSSFPPHFFLYRFKDTNKTKAGIYPWGRGFVFHLGLWKFENVPIKPFHSPRKVIKTMLKILKEWSIFRVNDSSLQGGKCFLNCLPYCKAYNFKPAAYNFIFFWNVLIFPIVVKVFDPV